jgi:hypothetical protein
MKKLLIGIFAYFLTSSLFAIDVSVTHASFRGQPENYIEFYFYLVGKSLKQVQIDSINSQATVEFIVLFKQKDSIFRVDKFNLKSPATLDATDFYEMRRYGLPNGTYDIEVQLKDVNNEGNKAVYRSSFIMDYDERNLRMSDVSLLSQYKPDSSDSKYVKNGYFMTPLPFQFYDRTYSQLTFYNEIYNTDKVLGNDFLFSYAIEKANAKPYEKSLLIGHKRHKASSYVVNLINLDI